uniref:Uncharacterized protein n=1 Tax=Fusarium oxysporum (strain Fo5176) TaxID=660025 RepID=A0A0D2Y6L2_FUSOF
MLEMDSGVKAVSFAQVSGSFEPYFTIQEQGYPSNEITVLLSEDTINTIGFPRELVDEHRQPGPPRPPVNSGLRRDSSGRRRFWNNRPMHNQGSIDEHGLDALGNLTLSQRLTDLQSGSNMFNIVRMEALMQAILSYQKRHLRHKQRQPHFCHSVL